MFIGLCQIKIIALLSVYLRDEVEVHVDRILTGKVRSIFCKERTL